MFRWQCQNILPSNGFSAIRLNSLKYDSRFVFTGILQEVDIHLAIKKAGSKNIKSVTQTVNHQLFLPVTSVSSQSNQVSTMVEVVMGKQNGFYFSCSGRERAEVSPPASMARVPSIKREVNRVPFDSS
jgi:hypothetical protein